MAKRPAKKPKKKSSALGYPPAEHQLRASTFARKAEEKLREAAEAQSKGDCKVAFANLIDGVYNSGAAETETEASGAGGAAVSKYKKQAVDAIKAFRAACKME